MSRKNLLLAFTITCMSASAGFYAVLTPSAKAQLPGTTSNGECVNYGANNALTMCLHKFNDGTRCVAAGGAGVSGAAAALQCNFN